jgi:hypothetical protein
MCVKSIRALLRVEPNTRNAHLLCEMTHKWGRHIAVRRLVTFISETGKHFAI